MSETEKKPRVRINEIRFFLHPDTTQDQNPRGVLETIQRLARLVTIDDCDLRESLDFEFAGGYRWRLDNSNDWLADIGANGDAPNEVVLFYRDGHPDDMTKLRDVIIWRLGLRPYNQD